MSNGKPPIHPICEGRTVYTKAKLAKLQKENNNKNSILYPIVTEEMAIVRNNVSRIASERQLLDSYCAASIGISKYLWSFWMSDPKRNLSVEAMLALSDLLGCTFNELIMGENAPIRLSKKCSLLYTVIKSRAVLHATCDKLLGSTPIAPVESRKLIYCRMKERADDLNRPLRNILLETSLDFSGVARDCTAEDPAFNSRLPAFFGLCAFFDDNADYFVRQDISNYSMIANKQPVESMYQKTIGKFAALTTEQQENILGYLLHERYLK